MILGRMFMPVIDLLFFWQGPGHCKNHTSKYRTGIPIFESRPKHN